MAIEAGQRSLLLHLIWSLLPLLLAAAAAAAAAADLADVRGGTGGRSKNCFDIRQGGRVQYSLPAFNGTNAVVTLKFLSYHKDGVILYLSGHHGDYMGLYLKDGILNYFIFNPSRLDWSLRGIQINTKEPLETNKDYSVEFMYNFAQYQSFRNSMLFSTGLRLDNREVEIFDYHIPDIQFKSPIYLGGGPTGLNLHVPDFEGLIRDVRINDNYARTARTNQRVKEC